MLRMQMNEPVQRTRKRRERVFCQGHRELVYDFKTRPLIRISDEECGLIAETALRAYPTSAGYAVSSYFQRIRHLARFYRGSYVTFLAREFAFLECTVLPGGNGIVLRLSSRYFTAVILQHHFTCNSLTRVRLSAPIQSWAKYYFKWQMANRYFIFYMHTHVCMRIKYFIRSKERTFKNKLFYSL